jgi:DNA invertase Pin-like site-specific DNA recombinase
MEKIFAYLRVSDSTQVEKDGKPKDGFTRQLKACTDYALRNNLEIAGVYKEDISGTEYNRPVLAQLMVSLEKNHHGVRTVIIERLDRLARDLMIQEAIIRDFQIKGFTLISTEEGPDLTDNSPTRKFIRQVLGAVAEYDKTMLVAKLRASRDRMRAATGRCEGRLGYKGTKEGIALERRIKALYSKPKYGKRKTLREIAEALNAEGILTINHRVWTSSSVRDVIFDR